MFGLQYGFSTLFDSACDERADTFAKLFGSSDDHLSGRFV
jgi:hypothetical protein